MIEPVQRQHKFRHLSVFPGRTLVLSPHYDDETLGCGGTIIKSVRKGGFVQVAFATSSPRPGDEDSRIRKNEAEQACARLGVSSVLHWNQPIRNIDTSALADRIVEAVTQSNPTIVALPWYGDNHLDHRQLNTALAQASGRAPNLFESMKVLGYEVWTPAPVDAISDITEVMEIKISALREYRTQLKQWRYEEMVSALNAFRAYGKVPPAFSRVLYAEGFVYQPIAVYLQRADAVSGDSDNGWSP